MTLDTSLLHRINLSGKDGLSVLLTHTEWRDMQAEIKQLRDEGHQLLAVAKNEGTGKRVNIKNEGGAL